MRFCYYREPTNKNDVKVIAIRCINCGEETGLSMNNMNTKYEDIFTSFVLNTLLQRVVMSWIIETHNQLKYDMKKIQIG